MKAKTSVNSFGTFLETMKKQKVGVGQTAQELPTRILLYLSERRNPVPVREMISDLGVPVTLAVNALHNLENLNLVKLSVIGADDVAEITPSGVQAARLSR